MTAFDRISYHVELIIASLVNPTGSAIRVLIMDVKKQENGSDCGVFSIANLTAELHGLDPVTQNYDISRMRNHLFECLEKKQMSPFPTIGGERKHKTIRKQILIELFCSCRKPDDGFYFTCSGCKCWFHPNCEGLTSTNAEIRKMKEVYCRNSRPTRSLHSRKRMTISPSINDIGII